MPQEKENTKCSHEDNIIYKGLVQVDGVPQYQVQCRNCNKNGIIFLVEDGEEWE